MRISKKLFILMLLFFYKLAFAVDNNTLYMASVPVNTQSETERAQVLPRALAQVLIKVSGNRSVVTLPRIKDDLSGANNLVATYRYEKQSSNTTSPYCLIVDFDQKAVNHILKMNHQAIWGNDRPLLLFWIAEQTNGQTVSLGNDVNNHNYQAIKHSAQLRGVPISYPLYDLTDLSNISAQDIIQQNEPHILTASQRYPHTGIVTLVLSKNNDATWAGHFILDIHGTQDEFSLQGKSKQAVINSGVNQLADELASQYSVLDIAHGAGHTYQMQIYGIKSVDDFTAISQYLKQLTPVQTVTVNQVFPDHVAFSLQVLGDKRLLEQAISLDQVLLPDNTVTPEKSDDLVYRVYST